jgi:hypothetical protein
MTAPTHHRTFNPKRLGRLGAAALVASGLLAAACGSDEKPSGGSVANCAPTDPSCPALDVQSECLALVDNSGKDKFALRLSQLTVKLPTVLTTPLIAKIVGDGVFINMPECNVAGLGTFSLITEFDRSNGKLRVGGAKPQANPTDGYCFLDDNGNNIAPIEVNAQFASDGSVTVDPIPSITVPIYQDLTAQQVVYLPLRQAVLKNAKLSSDNNCVGSFNAAGLEPINQCKPDLEAGINYFVGGAGLEGHITLEEADQVVIDLLTPKQSLCVLLSGDVNTYSEADAEGVLRCKRDSSNSIELKGDWCDATNSAGGCQDAFRLDAEIASSSVKLRDDCQP